MSGCTLVFPPVMHPSPAWMTFSVKFNYMKTQQYRVDVYLQIYWVHFLLSLTGLKLLIEFNHFLRKIHLQYLNFFLPDRANTAYRKLITFILLSYKSKSKKKKNLTAKKPMRKHIEKGCHTIYLQIWKGIYTHVLYYMMVVGNAYGASYSFYRCMHKQTHNYLLQMYLTIS